MRAFIKQSTAISAQPSVNKPFPWKMLSTYSGKLDCLEPNYKDYFPPMKIRRMRRLVKMALTSAKICLEKSEVDMPEAIITATGWGCLDETYKYLKEMADETIATPSPAIFIQSTHNTPGGQIALSLGCQNYNNVIVSGPTSFENGLIDALMLINEGKDNILIGGFDEIAEADFDLKREAGYWKSPEISNQDFIYHNSPGTLAGEGAGFFVLSNKKDSSASEIKFCSVIHCSPHAKELKKDISEYLKRYDFTLDNIDVVLSGANGDNRVMPLYQKLENESFTNNTVVHYKKLCGEYDTSSAFALWLADNILKSQKLPDYLNGSSEIKTINNILVYNYAGGNKHAITLISKADI